MLHALPEPGGMLDQNPHVMRKIAVCIKVQREIQEAENKLKAMKSGNQQ